MQQRLLLLGTWQLGSLRPGWWGQKGLAYKISLGRCPLELGAYHHVTADQSGSTGLPQPDNSPATGAQPFPGLCSSAISPCATGCPVGATGCQSWQHHGCVGAHWRAWLQHPSLLQLPPSWPPSVDVRWDIPTLQMQTLGCTAEPPTTPSWIYLMDEEKEGKHWAPPLAKCGSQWFCNRRGTSCYLPEKERPLLSKESPHNK